MCYKESYNLPKSVDVWLAVAHPYDLHKQERRIFMMVYDEHIMKTT